MFKYINAKTIEIFISKRSVLNSTLAGLSTFAKFFDI